MFWLGVCEVCVSGLRVTHVAMAGISISGSPQPSGVSQGRAASLSLWDRSRRVWLREHFVRGAGRA